MEQTVFELDLLEEARDFLKSLTKEIRGKDRLQYPSGSERRTRQRTL